MNRAQVQSRELVAGHKVQGVDPACDMFFTNFVETECCGHTTCIDEAERCEG